MSRSSNRCARFILLATCVLVTSSTAHAANRRWNGAAVNDDNFGTTANWVGGLVPGTLDVAQFGISGGMFGSTYKVDFNNNVTNQALHIEDDFVTFNLSGRTYTATTANGIVIGNQAGGFSGRLTVNGGTISSSTNIDVGAAANTTGTLIVGANGLISGSPTINIGKLGTGTLTVQADGDISSTGSTTIGVGNGITGTATIFGNGTAGSATLLTGTLNVGSIGDGTVNVQFGGLLQNSGGARLGTGSLFTGVGTGIVNVMNAGSTWNSLGLLEVGDGGSGEVNITLGGKATGADSVIGANVNGGGEVNVDGPSSLWDSSGTLTIGELGTGTLNITNQGVVENQAGIIGNSNISTSIGTVTVNGAGSLWRNTSSVFVGFRGTGTLNITGGGTVESIRGDVGLSPGSTGNVTVDGIGSVWAAGDLIVGNSGEGTLTITAGGVVQGSRGIVSGNGSSVTVNGDGSLWESFSNLTIAGGTLEITGGGQVSSVTAGLNIFDVIGPGAGSTGHVTVDGDDSLWHNFTGIYVGDEGDGTLEISNGGTVIDRRGIIGSGSGGTGHVTVDSSVWSNTDGPLFVGVSGQGTLEITNGAVVQNTGGLVGGGSTGIGHVTVNGFGSLWDNSASLTIGLGGEGTLDITAGGVVTTNNDAIIGQLAGSTAIVTVTGANSTWLIGGQLEIGYDLVAGNNGGTGTLRIQPGGTVNVPLNTFVSAGDLLSLEGGTLSASTINFPDGGNADTNFQWTSGTLHVGFFDGDLVNQAGVLAPGNSIGSTVINAGNYNQLADATLEVEIGGTTLGIQHDVVFILGNAFLGGDLELALIDGFVPTSADTFTILQATLNVFNSFANVANGQRLAIGDGFGSFVVNYGAGSLFDDNEIVLSNFLAAAIPGDYNQNGTVDAADYTIWRNHLGQNFTLTNENPAAATPGVVDAEDYAFWKSHFGESLGSGSGATANATVPELANLVLLMLAAIGWCVRRSRDA